MNESLLRFYLGRDKGKAVVVAAPDRKNAQTMVDASTRLYPFSYSQEDAEHVCWKLWSQGDGRKLASL